MKIAFNPTTALTSAPQNNDITFDLVGHNIYARGVKFAGTDTTYDVFKKDTSNSTGGRIGLVPVPDYNNNSQTRFLREDGTWVNIQVPASITYTFEGGVNSFKVTPSNGTTQTIQITPNVTLNDILCSNYTIATEIKNIATTDTLNSALGKLEYKADLGVTAYSLISAANNGESIDNLAEILKVLEGIKDTETIQAIIGKYLPLSGGTITGTLTLSKEGSDILVINRLNSSSPTTITYRKDGTLLGRMGFDASTKEPVAQVSGTYQTLIHSGNIGSQTVAAANKLSTARKIWGQSFDGSGDVNGNIVVGVESKDYTTQNYIYMWKGDGTYRHRGLQYVNEQGYSFNYYNPNSGVYKELRIGPNGLSFANENSSKYSFIINSSGTVTVTGNLNIDGGTDTYRKISIGNETSGRHVAIHNAGGIIINGTNVGRIAELSLYENSSRLGGVGVYSEGPIYIDGTNGVHKIALENLTTITKTLTVTKDWMDTGISASDLETGTYAVQVYVDSSDNGIWKCYWSGVMTWYAANTDDSDTDEILLHRSGHHYDRTIYLRTVMQAKNYLKLQIAASKAISSTTYTFKFKKLI